MKPSISSLVAIFFLLSRIPVYPLSSTGHEISFYVPSLKNQMVRLGSFYGMEMRYIDSVRCDAKGQATFKGVNELPAGLYVFSSGDQTLDFVVAEQRFSISAPTAPLEWSAKIKNSQENKIYFGYKQTLLSKKRTLDSLRHQMEINGADEKTKMKMDSTASFIKFYRNSLIAQYPNSLACKIIQAGLKLKSIEPRKNDPNAGLTNNKWNREKLFENIDVSDERLIRTPYLEEKMIAYLKLTTLSIDSLAKSCDEIVAKAYKNAEVAHFLVDRMLHHFDNSKPYMDVMYTYVAKKYILKSGPWKVDSTEVLNVKATVKRMEPLLTGKIAPAINFIDSAGREIPLYSVKAKFTVLYFWDADCSHCQEITPKMWDLYVRMRSRGVEVYAVTVQQIWYTWLAYIREHHLSWINVWEPEKIQETYKTYQIGTTPTIFLLDENKRIIYKKISLEELETNLERLTQALPK
jgi:peroxiredoxin